MYIHIIIQLNILSTSPVKGQLLRVKFYMQTYTRELGSHANLKTNDTNNHMICVQI